MLVTQKSSNKIQHLHKATQIEKLHSVENGSSKADNKKRSRSAARALTVRYPDSQSGDDLERRRGLNHHEEEQDESTMQVRR